MGRLNKRKTKRKLKEKTKGEGLYSLSSSALNWGSQCVKLDKVSMEIVSFGGNYWLEKCVCCCWKYAVSEQYNGLYIAMLT